MKSSISDYTNYPQFCELAVSDDSIFACFKSYPEYTYILEHVPKEHGLLFLQHIMDKSRELVDFFPKFKENDLYGTPQTYSFGPIGEFSPTTLRYIKVLGDLLASFGKLTDMRIVEIGGGYGGQCKIINDYCGFKSYVLVDLEPCLKLAKKYLDKFGIKNVEYCTMEQLKDNESHDLTISNYAFSECIREVQDTYFEKVISKARRGYMTCNLLAQANFPNCFTRQELIDNIPAQYHEEDPLTAPGNYILTWGESKKD